jgi:hypothetical protein
MGVFDDGTPTRAGGTRPGVSRIATGDDPDRIRPPKASAKIVHAPVPWLAGAPVLLVLSVLALLVIGSSTRGYLAAYLLAIAATIFAVVTTFEDQRRMKSPSYSMMKNFRLLCFMNYAASTAVTLVYLGMVAFNAAR